MVTTADPNCLFVNDTYGMSGSHTNCTAANSDIANYDTANSSFGHAVEQPPANDTQLGTIAQQNGCLYSGPTTDRPVQVGGVGQMTVTSPDTPEGTQTVNGTNYTWDSNNIPSNVNYCPNDGSTAPLPSNGVVFVQNASAGTDPGLGQSLRRPHLQHRHQPSPPPGPPLRPTRCGRCTLKATVTSGSSTLDQRGHRGLQTDHEVNGQHTNTISTCTAAQSLTGGGHPGHQPPPTATATCSFTEASQRDRGLHRHLLGRQQHHHVPGQPRTTNTFTSSISYGPDAQVTAGGCNSCYYGQTSSPNAEGDAFVNGSLSGQLTIGTANNVIITGNLTYADCNWTTGQSGSSAPSQGLCPYNLAGANDVLGLIANQYVEVNRPLLTAGHRRSRRAAPPRRPPVIPPTEPTASPSMPPCWPSPSRSSSTTTRSGGSEGPLYVYGSIQQYARGPVGTFSGNSISSGYVKHYTWDPLLDFVSPPSYLAPSTPSWVLASVTTNAGAGSASVCPPLTGIYNGITNGVIQDGPAITNVLLNAATGACPTIRPLPHRRRSPASRPRPTSTASVTLNWTDPASNGGHDHQRLLGELQPCLLAAARTRA